MFLQLNLQRYIKLYSNFFVIKFNTFFLYIFIYKNYYIVYNFYLALVYLNYFFKFFMSYNVIYFYKYNLFKFFNSLFFVEFILDGLYYRVKYYKNYNILGFILGYNHYILYKLPKFIFACVHMKKRRFFLYGFNLVQLGSVGSEIINLKYPNLFKGKGVKVVFLNYRKKILVKKQK